jgi:hypothetical protein
MEKVGFVASYWLERQLIEIGRFLRQQNSLCHYNDYVNVFRAKHGSKISVESICRVLRKLRERGIFFTPPRMRGQFFICDRFLEKKDVVIK